MSLSIECTASDGDAAFSRLTPDGRYLVFESSADDLVPDDLNGGDDVFLFDLDARALELISKKYGADTPGRGDSFTPVLSDDARYVAFTAYSYELTSAMPSEGLWVYLRDRRTGTTRRLPADYVCAYWVDMSGDGAFIVAEGYTRCDGGLDDGDFDSAVEYDTAGDTMRHLGAQDGGDNYRPAISRDGRFIVWAIRPAMTRGTQTSQLQIFDRETDTVETLPFTAFHYSSLDVSDAGDVIAFSQNRQVYRYDRSADELTLVTKDAAGEVGDDWSDEVSLSGDGRYLAFESDAKNLVEGDTNGVGDIFLYDAVTQSLQRLSVAPDGAEADGESTHPHIAGNGARVSFASKARNLLPAATSGDYQLYVRSLKLE